MPSVNFQDILGALGMSSRVVEFNKSTRSAQQAADAIGVEISQIVKSLVFKTTKTGQPIMVLCSGSNLVDENKLTSILGEQVIKADADFVREKSGFSIGGVPPFGHASPIQVYIDQDLQDFTEIWAAAGSHNKVFPLTPQELASLSKGTWLLLKKDR